VTVESRYKREGDSFLIELKIKQIGQLYNSLDPSPFIEKDLDDDAVDYLFGAAKEFPLKQPLKLVIHMPLHEMKRISETHLKKSFASYFHYYADNSERRMRNKLRDGRAAFMIGLIALIASITMADFAEMNLSGFIREIAVNGFIIGGWAAMWFPITVFLYEWWPLARESKLYRKLANMEIDVRFE